MYVADTLSRAYLNVIDDDSHPGDKLEEDIEAQVHHMTHESTTGE